MAETWEVWACRYGKSIPFEEQRKRYLVMYSGGVMSYLAAKRVLDKVPKEQVKLVFCDTKTEDQDLYRFLVETSNFLDVPITWLQDGRDVWQVMFDVRLLGNTKFDPCSRVLKRQLIDKYIETNYRPETCVRVYGFGWEEEHRAVRLAERLKPWECWSPLLGEVRPYTALLEEVESDGIQVPRLYRLGFTHNNCGGFCIKAGKKQFKRLLEAFPERYQHHEQKEQELLTVLDGHGKLGLLRHSEKKVKRYITLRQYRLMLEQGALSPDDIEGDVGSCGCFINEEQRMGDYGMGIDETLDSVASTPFGVSVGEQSYGFDMPNGHTGVVESAFEVDPAEDSADDDLWAVDHEADEKTIKDSLPPVGDYEVQLSAGPMEVKEVEGTRIPDQRFFGMGVRYVGETAHKARIRFSLCPKKIIKTNGKTHWAYLMYVSARKAFLAINKRPHESYAELSEWLTQNPVKARITHTQDNDYMTVEIKPSYTDIPF